MRDGSSLASERPDGTTRFCDACEKHVHDLSGMTEDEARALLAAPSAEGHCVRYVHDAAGNIAFFGDRPKLVPPRSLVRSTRALAVALLALPLSMNACMTPALPGSTMPGPPIAPQPASPATPDGGADPLASASSPQPNADKQQCDEVTRRNEQVLQ